MNTKKKPASGTSGRSSGSKRKLNVARSFVDTLSYEQLTSLTAELQSVRSYPPLTQRKDGKYEGDILGFVKGLRLAARLIYWLRERLSKFGKEVEISWGQVLNDQGSCSRECDIIIHQPGHIREWNGTSGAIMHFRFVGPRSVLAVISCKSLVIGIDEQYPKDLQKFGIKKVFLFAECCVLEKLADLKKRAKMVGYQGLWCLYRFAASDKSAITNDEPAWSEFGKMVERVVSAELGRR